MWQRRITWILLFTLGQTLQAKSPIVLWDTLALNNSQKPGDKLKIQNLDKQSYRIPGFMVPLESNPKASKEFIFVPALPTCIHVPPPPPNQTIHVKMKAGASAPLSWEPIWVEGRIKPQTTTIKDFGDASYEMEASTVTKVSNEDMNEITKMLPQPTYVMDCNGRDKLDPACSGPQRPSGGKKPTPFL